MDMLMYIGYLNIFINVLLIYIISTSFEFVLNIFLFFKVLIII